MRLNEIYSTVCTGKCMSDTFPNQNGLKHGHVSSPMLFKFALQYIIRKIQEKSSRTETEWCPSPSGLC
jgi:hypothetical protein